MAAIWVFMMGNASKSQNVATGGVEVLAEIPEAAIWAGERAWNSTGDIVIAVQGLFHMPASGGPLKPLIMRDLARGEYFLGFPQFLPDGLHYLFTAFGRGAAPKEVYVGTLGSNARKPILRADSAGWYAEPGYLVFARGGTLFAQPFNADRLSLSGRPERIAAGLRKNSFGGAMERVPEWRCPCLHNRRPRCVAIHLARQSWARNGPPGRPDGGLHV